MEPIQRRHFAEPDRVAVQEKACSAVEADPQPFLTAYRANPNNHGGRYVCADAFKDTFEDYRASAEARNRYNSPVHNAAAALTSEQYRRLVRDNDEPQRDLAVFLTGIPGAGKTSSVLARGIPSNARVIFEEQLNRPESSMEMIQLALDADLKVGIVAVHVAPELALRRTFTRFEEYGRGATIGVMAEMQAGLPDGLRRIHERFGDAVSLTIHDNRIPGQHKKLQGWQRVKQLTQEGNHEHISQRLWAELERHRAEGRVSEACYRQANGDAPLGPIRRVERSGDQTGQPDGDRRGFSQGSGQAFHLSAPRPARALAFEQLPEAQALEAHPELMGAFRELAANRVAIAKQFPAEFKAREAPLTAVKADIQRRLDDGRIPPLPKISREPPPGHDGQTALTPPKESQ